MQKGNCQRKPSKNQQNYNFPCFFFSMGVKLGRWHWRRNVGHSKIVTVTISVKHFFFFSPPSRACIVSILSLASLRDCVVRDSWFESAVWNKGRWQHSPVPGNSGQRGARLIFRRVRDGHQSGRTILVGSAADRFLSVFLPLDVSIEWSRTRTVAIFIKTSRGRPALPLVIWQIW